MVLLRSICLTILFFLLGGGAYADAGPSIVITPTTAGGDIYIISAAGIRDASGVEFSFSYDTLTITNPIITPGQFLADSNVIMEANTDTPGSIQVFFAIGGAFKGDGQLAKITFTKIGKLPGRVFNPKSAVFSASSEQIAAQTIIATSATPSSDAGLSSSVSEAAPNNSSTPSSSSSSSSGGMSTVFSQAQQQRQASSGLFPGGETTNMYNQAQQQQQSGSYQSTVTSSGNTLIQQNVRREEPKRDEPVRAERKSSAPQETAQATTLSAAKTSVNTAQTGVVNKQAAINSKEALVLLKAAEMPVQRYRAFKGARTVKGLVPLFDNIAVRKAGIVQVPDIVIADGKEMVTVKIKLAAPGMVPNFSLRGANLKSIRPISDTEWELEALPRKGKYDVHLTVLLGSEQVDIPLVVIPPLDLAVIRETQELSEKGVGALLAKADIKSDKPVYDLNSDGRQDFVDDYLLIAHYLKKSKNAAKPAEK